MEAPCWSGGSRGRRRHCSGQREIRGLSIDADLEAHAALVHVLGQPPVMSVDEIAANCALQTGSFSKSRGVPDFPFIE